MFIIKNICIIGYVLLFGEGQFSRVVSSHRPNDMIFTFTLDPKMLGDIKIFPLNISLLERQP